MRPMLDGHFNILLVRLRPLRGGVHFILLLSRPLRGGSIYICLAVDCVVDLVVDVDICGIVLYTLASCRNF